MQELIQIYPNVQISSPSIVESFVILGHPLSNGTQPKLIIGSNAYIRSHSVIYAGNLIGCNFICGHGILIREDNRIGDNVSVGTHSIVEKNSQIEKNVRIHSNVYIPENCYIQEHAWIGPNAVFVNDPHPPCAKCMRGPEIGSYSKIGANVTILDHVKIGANVLIGAGSVVTKDVPEGCVYVGNPAKYLMRIDELKCFESDKLLQNYKTQNFKVI